jgi:allantoicase
MAGKPVDTTSTMTGKSLRVELRRETNEVVHRAIIKLGTTGTICGFDIDTSHFNGVFTRV